MTFATLALLCLLPIYVSAEPPNPNPISISSLDLSVATQGFGLPQADKTVDGHTLTLQGRPYKLGFGTHAPGRLAIDLQQKAQRFQAVVGVDDEVGPGKGHVEFQVWADGKRLWTSRVLRSGDTPQVVDVSLLGVKQLILRVTTAGAIFDFCHADWADGLITMSTGQPHTVRFRPDDETPRIAMTSASEKPQIHPPFVVGVRPGKPLLWTVPVTGLRPLAFVVRGLPSGVLINTLTGTLSGKAPTAGDYPIHIRVTNRAGSDEKNVHLIAGSVLALTPPLGWNSYDAYGDSVTESEVIANAEVMRKSMQPYGWDTIVVDYRWYDPGAYNNDANGRAGAILTLDEYGRLLPALNRFPSAADGRGFQALATRIHGMGLRFGIHIMRGIPRDAVKRNLPIEGSAFHAADAGNTQDTCIWCPDMFGVHGDTEAGRAYYASLFRLYASWGVDFVKMDDTSVPYHTDEINAVRTAIDLCGRSIIYSLSPGETPIAQAAHVADHANQWRVSGDFWDNWQSLDHEFTLGTEWKAWTGPGHWPDADMLPVGRLSRGNRSVGGDRNSNFTKSEQVTLLSLWALLPSPLMVGAALPENDPWTLALLTNPEVIAVNQDALGAAGGRVSSMEDTEVWAKERADGSKAVGLFNRGDFAQRVTADFAALGFSGRCRVRDLWRHEALGVWDRKITLTVPAHGAVLLEVRRS